MLAGQCFLFTFPHRNARGGDYSTYPTIKFSMWVGIHVNVMPWLGLRVFYILIKLSIIVTTRRYCIVVILHHNLPDTTDYRLFKKGDWRQDNMKAEKLKCLLNYFKRVTTQSQYLRFSLTCAFNMCEVSPCKRASVSKQNLDLESLNNS